jgi:hypothetical protein
VWSPRKMHTFEPALPLCSSSYGIAQRSPPLPLLEPYNQLGQMVNAFGRRPDMNHGVSPSRRFGGRNTCLPGVEEHPSYLGRPDLWCHTHGIRVLTLRPEDTKGEMYRNIVLVVLCTRHRSSREQLFASLPRHVKSSSPSPYAQPTLDGFEPHRWLHHT